MPTIYPAERVQSSLQWDEKFHRHYQSIYQVIASKDASPKEVANATGIPTYGTSYAWYTDVDAWAFCKSIDVQPHEDVCDPFTGANGFRRWLCTLSHSSEPFDGSNDGGNTPRDNPLNDPPVISGSFSPYQKRAELDKDGDAIVNSAKFPYDPGVTIDDAYDTLNISFNTATINLVTRQQYRGTVNSDSLWGLSPRQAKLMRWGYQILRSGLSVVYVKHTFEFLISYKENPPAANVSIGSAYASDRGWYTVLPNTGTHYYFGGTIAKENLVPFSPQDQPDIGKLKTNGDRLDDNDPVKWNIYAVEEELPFLSIPGITTPLPGPFV